MKRSIIIGALAMATLNTSHAADWTMLRRIAQGAGCAASMMDARTTLRPGVAETNPILGSGRPNAGRIIGFKIGVCAGQIALSEYQHHHHPENARNERWQMYGGSAQAAVYGTLAFRNSRIGK